MSNFPKNNLCKLPNHRSTCAREISIYALCERSKAKRKAVQRSCKRRRFLQLLENVAAMGTTKPQL